MIRNTIFNGRVYFYLIILLAASMPLSVYASSVLQFALFFNWIIGGRYREKWNRLFKDRAFLIYSMFLVVHLVGMAWSEDIGYGLKDLKIKLPIVLIPFIIASSEELSFQQLRVVLTAFISGVIVSSLATIMVLLNIIHIELSDFRSASLFIDHIRFSLMVVLSILFAAYMLFKQAPGEHNLLRVLYLFTVLWLPVFLIILKSLSGLVIIVVLILVLSLRLVRSVPDVAGRFMLNVLIIFIPLFAIIYIGSSINRFYTVEQVDAGQLDSLTINGNRYIHHINNMEIENGNFVWINVSPVELEKEWNRISDYDYMGTTENGNFLRFTLIRYLASKGFRKDSVGISRLSAEDIAAIESGVANHIYLKRFSLYPRIYEVIWEFDRYRLGHTANDKSLIQRYYYLKAGVAIASQNLFFGVGTGDVRKSFGNYYEETNSPLRKERRRKSHNQFLSLAVAFGIPGLIICLLALILPVFIRKQWSSYMVIVFLLTMALSMLDEDTLENTPGAVLFGFFYGLFVFGKRWNWNQEIKSNMISELPDKSAE